MRVIAYSPNIGIDALEHESLPLWSFQPHPESTIAFLHSHGIAVTAESSKRLEFGRNLVRSFLQFCASNY
jgi:GMP synthase-like glutamine amidotransferase